MDDIPLCAEREVVVGDFGEVALLPDTAVDECNLIFGEFGDGIRSEVGNDSFRMFPKIADDVGHWSLFPVRIDLAVTAFAGLRTDIMRVGDRDGLSGFFLRGQGAEIADEEDEFPTVRIELLMRGSPRRHTREADASLYDVLELAVGEVLCVRLAKVGWFGVELAANLGLTTAVVGVADRATVEELLASVLENLWSGRKRVCLASFTTRN